MRAKIRSRVMTKKKRHKRPWYGWAPEVDERDPRLTPEGRTGLGYARELADDAAACRSAIAEWAAEGVVPYRRTPKDLAAERGVSPPALSALIRQARREIFGEISDRAIQHRLWRVRQVASRSPRCCATEGCDRLLPADARSNRRYCEECASPRDVSRRYRERRKRIVASMASIPGERT